ncbi:MAG: hypothetical protein COA78_13945 [Blastopirellula sp.]|nr:MAG: hypothetical protein COA78_13945 [Blastopirellula sp.]
MILRHDSTHSIMIAANGPGGQASHFRVQYFDSHEAAWMKSGVYACQKEAEQALVELQQTGRQARIIHYTNCPASR